MVLGMDEKEQDNVDAVQLSILELVQDLAARNFAPRAADYDRRMAFPREDFDDLYRAGLLGATIAREDGGLGLGPNHGDSMTLWAITKAVAKADLSLARCWESHINALIMLDGMANRRQKAVWFEGVLRRGELWAAWGGEPQSPTPWEKAPAGVYLEEVEGGYQLSGSKVYCTGAGSAQWALLMVSATGPGGFRDGIGPPEARLLLACDTSDPSLTIDTSWWDPIGMRSTSSHRVLFDKTFIPHAMRVGYPGQYSLEGWQMRFVPQYAATFLGAAEGAYESALDYIRCQDKGGDPYIQQHVGQMAVNIEAGNLWIKHVASLWDCGRQPDAQLAGSCARHAIEHLSLETVRLAILACGSRSLNRPSPLERIYRDLSFYVRHDNDDHLLATIGRSILGQIHDMAFNRI
jgi:alkylation response protein AidB-like acyl-CoA dehydrogenase